MPLEDLVTQLDKEIAEHNSAAASLTGARDALAAAQAQLDTATTSAGKEKGEVVTAIDAVMAELTRLRAELGGGG